MFTANQCNIRYVTKLAVTSWMGFFHPVKMVTVIRLYTLMMTKCNVVVAYFICVKYIFYLIQ